AVHGFLSGKGARPSVSAARFRAAASNHPGWLPPSSRPRTLLGPPTGLPTLMSEDSMTQARSREGVIQQDVHDLHRLGYARELLRSMGGFSNFAISFSIISILTGALILYDYGLPWAGTAAVSLRWALITILVPARDGL